MTQEEMSPWLKRNQHTILGQYLVTKKLRYLLSFVLFSAAFAIVLLIGIEMYFNIDAISNGDSKRFETYQSLHFLASAMIICITLANAFAERYSAAAKSLVVVAIVLVSMYLRS